MNKNKTGKILGIILLLLLGILLLSFSFQPPKIFTFLSGYGDRIVCSLLGGFFLLSGVMNIFYREK